ncbi:hypothetical protein C7212DRAFT_325484, partial [Tuber magnatum]
PLSFPLFSLPLFFFPGAGEGWAGLSGLSFPELHIPALYRYCIALHLPYYAMIAWMLDWTPRIAGFHIRNVTSHHSE